MRKLAGMIFLFPATMVLSLLIISPAGGQNMPNPANNTNSDGLRLETLIRGTIVDAVNGDTLRGATVQVMGSSIGGVVNHRGWYEFTTSRRDSSLTLYARHVGYLPLAVEVPIHPGQEHIFTFPLTEDFLRLDEVVVMGLPVQTTAEELGASRVGLISEEVMEAPVATVDEMFQGRIPGVEVYTTDGAPGGGYRFRIRGVNSILGASEPLLIIDDILIDNANRSLAGGQSGTLMSSRANGMPFLGANDGARGLTLLNPADIARIEVLRGAASASLFGSRASNGVIIIQTKEGRDMSMPTFLYTTHIGFSQVSRGVKGYKSDWSSDQIQQWADSINTYLPAGDQSGFTQQEVNTFRLNAQTNWMNDAFQDGNFARNTFALQGGSPELSYYASFSTSQQNGVLRSTAYDGNGFHINMVARPTPRFEAHFRADISRDTRELVGGGGPSPYQPKSWYALSGAMPFMKSDEIRRAGAPFGTHLGLVHSKLFDVRKVLNQSRYFVSSTIKYAILDNLEFQGSLGLDYSDQAGRFVAPRDFNNLPAEVFDFFPEGRLDVDEEDVLQRTVTAGLHYQYDIGDIAYLKANIGLQYDDSRRTYVWNRYHDRPEEANQWRVNSYSTHIAQQEYYSEVQTLGLYASQTFGYKNRLFVNTGLRLDRGSAFRAKFYAYPRASVNYLALPEVQVHLAWGTSGLQPPPYQVKPLYAFDPTGYNGSGGAYKLVSAGNANLRPERQAEIEFGIDAVLWDGKILFNMSLYRQTYTDLMLVVPADPATNLGLSTRLENAGEMQNRGLEIGAGMTVWQGDDFSWNTRLDAEWLSNKVTELSVSEILDDALGDGSGFENLPRVKKGYPIGGFWGLSSKNEAVTALIEQGLPVPDSLATYLGSPLPAYKLSMQQQLDYKGFFLNINIAGKFGHKKYTSSERVLADPQVRIHTDYWNKPQADLEQAQWLMDNWVVSANFIKIRSAAFGYEFPRSWIDPIRISKLRLWISGQNLFTLSSFGGAWDVESEVSGFNSSAGWVRGIDYFEPGQPRSFTFSIQIGM